MTYPVATAAHAAPRSTGNTAKLQAQDEVRRALVNAASPLRILDVGCVGPRGEFDFWDPLLADPQCAAKFRLWGVDVQGVDKAQRYAQEHGWHNVELRTGSSDNLARLFPRGSFDIIVSTQVMEHIRHRPRFMNNAHAVLAENGTAYLTMDSAHFPRKAPSPADRVQALLSHAYSKVRGAPERFVHAVYDHEIEPLFAQSGFAIEDKRFYCLHPLKEIHNHKLDRSAQDQFLQSWKDMEDLLNSKPDFVAGNKHYFMALYYKLRRLQAPAPSKP